MLWYLSPSLSILDFRLMLKRLRQRHDFIANCPHVFALKNCSGIFFIGRLVNFAGVWRIFFYLVTDLQFKFNHFQVRACEYWLCYYYLSTLSFFKLIWFWVILSLFSLIAISCSTISTAFVFRCYTECTFLSDFLVFR